jgi:hypothetical protein
VCSCETEDANGERASAEMTCSEKDMSADRNNDMCKGTGKSLADKHKLGIFKSLKKRLQLKTNIGVRPVNCKSKHTFKGVESSSNCSFNLSEDAAGQATDYDMAHVHCKVDTWCYKHTLSLCYIYCFPTATMGS